MFEISTSVLEVPWFAYNVTAVTARDPKSERFCKGNLWFALT